jgi:hypothetical protein
MTSGPARRVGAGHRTADPVDGVAAYVDLIEGRVFKVLDEADLPVPGSQVTTTTRR